MLICHNPTDTTYYYPNWSTPLDQTNWLCVMSIRTYAFKIAYCGGTWARPLTAENLDRVGGRFDGLVARSSEFSILDVDPIDMEMLHIPTATSYAIHTTPAMLSSLDANSYLVLDSEYEDPPYTGRRLFQSHAYGSSRPPDNLLLTSENLLNSHRRYLYARLYEFSIVGDYV